MSKAKVYKCKCWDCSIHAEFNTWYAEDSTGHRTVWSSYERAIKAANNVKV